MPMRLAQAGAILFRIAVAAACILCAWQSIRFARIDWLANNGIWDGLQQAIRMDPQNPGSSPERPCSAPTLVRNLPKWTKRSARRFV